MKTRSEFAWEMCTIFGTIQIGHCYFCMLYHFLKFEQQISISLILTIEARLFKKSLQSWTLTQIPNHTKTCTSRMALVVLNYYSAATLTGIIISGFAFIHNVVISIYHMRYIRAQMDEAMSQHQINQAGNNDTNEADVELEMIEAMRTTSKLSILSIICFISITSL